MSNREKRNRHKKTEALSLPDFQKCCGAEEISASELEKDLKNRGISAVFININKLYPLCEDEKDVYQATRGFWKASLTRISAVDYVFAHYHSQIVGIYFVNRNKKNWMLRNEIGIIREKNRIFYEEGDDAPLSSYPYETRKKEYDWHNIAVEAGWDCDEFQKKLLGKKGTALGLEHFIKEHLGKDATNADFSFSKAFSAWKCRKFFTQEEPEGEKADELRYLKEAYLEKVIYLKKEMRESKEKNGLTEKTTYFSYQNPIRYCAET